MIIRRLYLLFFTLFALGTLPFVSCNPCTNCLNANLTFQVSSGTSIPASDSQSVEYLRVYFVPQGVSLFINKKNLVESSVVGMKYEFRDNQEETRVALENPTEAKIFIPENWEYPFLQANESGYVIAQGFMLQLQLDVQQKVDLRNPEQGLSLLLRTLAGSQDELKGEYLIHETGLQGSRKKADIPVDIVATWQNETQCIGSFYPQENAKLNFALTADSPFSFLFQATSNQDVCDVPKDISGLLE